MSLEELQAKRERLKQNSDITLNNMQKIANESLRVADVAHNSRQIIADLDKLDKAIVDLDLVMITKLEAYLGNFTARVKMPDRLNDAGDLIRHDEVYAVPFNSGDENLKEITPDDIWFLKMIKEAYKATNITFEEKSE